MTNLQDMKLEDLLAQREAIEKQIEQKRQSEISTAVTTIRDLIKQYNLTENDVFGRVRAVVAPKSGRSQVAPKYRDPETGKTWSGRGIAPKWLQGKDKAQYLIG